jgi:hypothetical protein
MRGVFQIQEAWNKIRLVEEMLRVKGSGKRT